MKIKLAVALVSTLFVSVVHAQTFTPGFYGGGELGESRMKDQSGSFSAGMVSTLGGTANASQDKNVFSGRLFGGYKIIENIDVELGYFQSNSYSINFNGVPRSGLAYSGNTSLKFSGFDYSVLLRPSISSGFNGAFLRLGGHDSKVKDNATVTAGNATGFASGSRTGNGFMIGFGYDFNVAKNVDIRAEYNHMDSIGGDSNIAADTIMIGVIGKF
jgi:opacity protein-like surface antigen